MVLKKCPWLTHSFSEILNFLCNWPRVLVSLYNSVYAKCHCFTANVSYNYSNHFPTYNITSNSQYLSFLRNLTGTLLRNYFFHFETISFNLKIISLQNTSTVVEFGGSVVSVSDFRTNGFGIEPSWRNSFFAFCLFFICLFFFLK